MKDDDKWLKLAGWAAAGRKIDGSPAPLGFSTRVAARWAAGEIPDTPNLWELFSVRSMFIALSIMVATVFVNYDIFSRGLDVEITMVDSIEGPLL